MKIVKVTAYADTYNLREAAQESMTVGEMIEILEHFPKDARAVYQKNSDSIYCSFDYDSFREL